MYDTSIVILFLLLAAASVTDLRHNRIPNLVSLGGILIAFVLNVFDFGASGLLVAFGGIAVGFALFALPYAFRVMGAGDVKLMMMVGAFLGWSGTAVASVFTLLVGGVMALIVVAAKGELAQLFRRYGTMLTALVAGQSVMIAPEKGEVAGTRFPYALAIAIGTAIALYSIRS